MTFSVLLLRDAAAFDGIAGRADRFPTQPNDEIHQRNLHRADFGATAAQARCVQDVAGLFDALHLRIEDLADRTGIGVLVGMAADPGVDRAMVHAGGAADAAQRLAQFRVV